MYSLMPSMITGIAQLDAEHQDLVSAINRIHEAEQSGSTPEVLNRLGEFRDHLAGHFKHEETYLTLHRYPGRDAHMKHHAETLVSLDRIVEELSSSLIELGGIAAECFTDLLGAILTMDMRFLNWQAELRRRAD
jgi:hemerythrin-like metal-binding protein